MKRAVILIVALLMSVPAYAQKNGSKDISILGPNDRSYAEATNTAALIAGRGLHIKSIHKSKLEGFFRGVWNAALYKTDKGAFQIIFFPEAKQAEKITVKEVQEGKRFIYSFEGQPDPNPPGDVFNAAYPMRFIMTDNLFVVVSDNEDLYEILKKILT